MERRQYHHYRHPADWRSFPTRFEVPLNTDSARFVNTDGHLDLGSKPRLASRLKLFAGALGVIALIILGMWLVFVLLNPVPHRTVAMAVYPEGTLNVELVKRYREVLAREGIELKPVPMAGSVEGVKRLREPKAEISVALVPGGITNERESPNLESLGTLFYQPLWIFSRRHSLAKRKHFRGLRISVGPEGSSSRALALQLLGKGGLIDSQSPTLFPFTPDDSVQKLTSGEIDVAIFLDGWESPAVQQLLHASGIRLEGVPHADAFVALHPYLNKMVVPAGSVDLAEPRPATDIVLVGPKSSLVIRNDLHPAIQYLLLEAAVEIHATPSIFRKAGQFPAAESIDLPLSPYAREFYKTGPPFLQRHLPFWLAVFLQEPAVWLIPILVLVFPLFRFAPLLYEWVEKRRVYRLYAELKRLEDEMSIGNNLFTRQDFVDRLDQLDARARRLSVPSPFKPLVYSLRMHIDVVRRRRNSKIAHTIVDEDTKLPPVQSR